MDSLVNQGTLCNMGSFGLYGTLTNRDSLTSVGSIVEWDSLLIQDTFCFLGSFIFPGTVGVSDSLGCYGAVHHSD